MVTGAAVRDGGVAFTQWMHSDDPCSVLDFVIAATHDFEDVTIVLEDIVGGGPLPKELRHTVELVGFFYWALRFYGFKVVKRWPQARLSCVNLVPPDIRQKDEISAAAHVLSYEEQKAKSDD
jgi:hypothetical protein